MHNKSEFNLMALKQEIIKLYTQESLPALLWLLVASYLCSLLASTFWIFDLFSHFLMQYCFAGVLFGASFVVLKQYKHATLAICIAALCLTESRANLQYPMQIIPHANASTQSVKLLQYNHNVAKQNFENVRAWLTKNPEKIDIIIFQEANEKTVEFASRIKDLFPYQIHEPRTHAFGTVIISRYPITERHFTNLSGNAVENFVIRTTIDIPNIKEPLALYALHAIPPVGKKHFEQRNNELAETANMISKDNHRYKVMIGDWNITPYSPFFTKLLEKSGLNYQANGLLLNPSWPCAPIYYLLRIPIDHVLFSASMQFIDKTVLPSFGSDHNAIVTTLGFVGNSGQ